MNPAYLMTQAKVLMDKLQADYAQSQRDLRQVRQELEALALGRYEFITRARKALMNDTDFGGQIAEFTEKEVDLQRRLAAIEQDLQLCADVSLET